MATFQPPTVEDVPPVYVVPDRWYPTPPLARRLFRHYKPRTRGRTVLKAADGSYSTVDVPTQTQVAAAAAVYLGGHVYEVSSAEAAALTAAGYGAGVS